MGFITHYISYIFGAKGHNSSMTSITCSNVRQTIKSSIETGIVCFCRRSVGSASKSKPSIDGAAVCRKRSLCKSLVRRITLCVPYYIWHEWETQSEPRQAQLPRNKTFHPPSWQKLFPSFPSPGFFIHPEVHVAA